MGTETKSAYTVRKGFFCPVGSSIHIGGETVNLTPTEFEERRHMLEDPTGQILEAAAAAKKEASAK